MVKESVLKMNCGTGAKAGATEQDQQMGQMSHPAKTRDD
jgi:hypothetical protein